MISLQGVQPLRICLQAAGGCLQHAGGLLSMLAADAATAADFSISAVSRSFTTTRSASGRLVLNENREKPPSRSNLYTKDNYKLLKSKGWSLDACQQVLHNHQQAQQRRQQRSRDHWNSKSYETALNTRILKSVTLDDLQTIIEQDAHRLSPFSMSVLIHKVPKVFLKPNGQPDHASAALLLDHVSNMMLPHVPQLGPVNIVLCLAAYLRCRYTPSDQMLNAMIDELCANNGRKLSELNLQNLSQLVLSLSRLTQSGHWQLLQAALEQTTQRLQQINSGTTPEPDSPASPYAESNVANSIALLANMFAHTKMFNREYETALYQWIAKCENLAQITGVGAVQLWWTLRSNFALQAGKTAAADGEVEGEPAAAADSTAADSAPAAAGGDGSSPAAAEGETLGLDQAAAALPAAAADPADARLAEIFGPGTLDTLAAVTSQRMSHMTQKELGQIFAAIRGLGYYDPDLMAAAAAAMERMYKAAGTNPGSGLSVLTCISAASAAAAGRQLKPWLLLPLWVAAVEQPAEFTGAAAGRLFWVTGMLSDLGNDVIQQQRQLVREELHRRNDRRGPIPESSSSVPEWITPVADSLPDRISEFKPNEVAHILGSYASIAGIPIHDQLFATAAKHIETHAHMFVKVWDIEKIAGAFEKMNYKEGVSALKALQQTAELAVDDATAV